MATGSLKSISFSISLFALFATGCSTLNSFSDSSTATSPLPAISGTVHGGIQPISGATVQLYATNTTTSKGASTALLTHLPVTSSAGKFTITDTNYCTAPGSLVYLVATGGNPGLTPAPDTTINNTDIALMALLGTCSTLSSATTITVNELTTVAAVEAVAPFMADSTHVGANTSNTSGMTTAFATAASLVNFSTGLQQPPTSGMTAPSALLNTLADILASCVSTSGGTSGSETNCGTLLQYSSTNTNTLAALLSIVLNPGVNVPQLFALVNAASPFQSTLASVPPSFALAISLFANTPYEDDADQLLADTQGHIWWLRPYPGTVSEYDAGLNLLHSYFVGQSVAGGLAFTMAIDPSNNLWVPDVTGGYLGLLKIGSDGTVLSPSGGFPVPTALLTGYNCCSGGTSISDSFGNIWYSVVRESDSAACLFEFSGAGALISPITGYCGSQISQGNGVSADTSGNIYLTGTTDVEKFSQKGSYIDFAFSMSGAVFDPGYQQFWGESPSPFLGSVKAINSFSPSGQVLATISALPKVPAVFTGDAVDGGGNFWLTDQSGMLYKIGPLGSSSCIDNSGSIPVLCGIQTTASFTTELAIDPAGDIFTIDFQHAALVKFEGLATAK